MLSLWPELFDFAPIAPFLLRVTLGLVFLVQGVKIIWHPAELKLPLARLVGLFELILGLLMTVGLFTQAVSVLILLELIGYLLLKKILKSRIAWSYPEILLLAIISFSLLILGPGFLAFDLPL